MAFNLREKQDLELLQAQFVGVGSSDTSSSEWRENVTRDTVSSIVGHPPMLQYVAIGTGECRERARIRLLERMIAPKKAPVAKEVEDPAGFGLANGLKAAMALPTPRPPGKIFVFKVDPNMKVEESD